jgi:hypothetical protein
MRVFAVDEKQNERFVCRFIPFKAFGLGLNAWLGHKAFEGHFVSVFMQEFGLKGFAELLQFSSHTRLLKAIGKRRWSPKPASANTYQ